MICRWCKGTGEECGCGEGYCTHCSGTGIITDPPFEHPYGVELHKIKPLEDSLVDKFAKDFCNTNEQDFNFEQFIQSIALSSCGEKIPSEDVQIYIDYWGNPNRGETLGDYILQIALRAKSINS